MNIQMLGFPVECPLEAYDSATEKIANHASQFDEVLAVYRMGNVAHPGISDLDVIVVVENAETLPPFSFMQRLTEMERQTLIHGVFVVSKAFWEQREIFFSFSNLTQLYGSTQSSITYEENIEQQVRMSIQHLVRVCLSNYVQTTQRCFKVRSLLCGLNAIRFDLSPLRNNISEDVLERTTCALEDLGELRASWFSNSANRDERMVGLVQSLDHCARLILDELSNSKAALAYDANCHGESEHRVSRRSSLKPHQGSVQGNCTPLARLAPWVWCLGLSKRNTNRVMNRLGRHTLRLPNVIYSAVRGFGSEQMDPEHRRRIELQNSILSSPTMKQVLTNGHSIPCLVDPGVKVLTAS